MKRLKDFTQTVSKKKQELEFQPQQCNTKPCTLTDKINRLLSDLVVEHVAGRKYQQTDSCVTLDCNAQEIKHKIFTKSYYGFHCFSRKKAPLRWNLQRPGLHKNQPCKSQFRLSQNRSHLQDLHRFWETKLEDFPSNFKGLFSFVLKDLTKLEREREKQNKTKKRTFKRKNKNRKCLC